MSETFHLSPADFWALRWDELKAYQDRLVEMNEQRQDAEYG